MGLEIGSKSDVGRRRAANEDRLDVLRLSGATLCVVADGMGGHQAGEEASSIAVETIRQYCAKHDPQTAGSLGDAVQTANRAVFAEAQRDPSKQGMGTTVVCALLANGTARLANVGDSPAFLLRGGSVRRLTSDHSWVAEEIERGALSADEAAEHPYRHILTRCLGMDGDVDVQLYEPVGLEEGDLIILCSDGLTEHVRSDDLPELIESSGSAQKAAERLVKAANERGGSDNISVIVAHWTDSRGP